MATHSSVRLENPRDGGAWWAAVYGVTQSQTRLKRLSSSSSRGRYCNPHLLLLEQHQRNPDKMEGLNKIQSYKTQNIKFQFKNVLIKKISK